MDRDDIIRMALEADFRKDNLGIYADDESNLAPLLERFAALVAAEKDKEIEQLRGEVEGLRWAYNTVTDDCRNLTEKVIPNIRSERDAAVAVLIELRDSAAYWSEYDVPLGIVDRINAAIDAAREAE